MVVPSTQQNIVFYLIQCQHVFVGVYWGMIMGISDVCILLGNVSNISYQLILKINFPPFKESKNTIRQIKRFCTFYYIMLNCVTRRLIFLYHIDLCIPYHEVYIQYTYIVKFFYSNRQKISGTVSTEHLQVHKFIFNL